MRNRSHFADIKKSDRLKKTKLALSGNRWRTTKEIERVTKSAAVHSDIHELRKNGYDIICNREKGHPTNERVWLYRLI